MNIQEAMMQVTRCSREAERVNAEMEILERGAKEALAALGFDMDSLRSQSIADVGRLCFWLYNGEWSVRLGEGRHIPQARGPSFVAVVEEIGPQVGARFEEAEATLRKLRSIVTVGASNG